MIDILEESNYLKIVADPGVSILGFSNCKVRKLYSKCRHLGNRSKNNTFSVYNELFTLSPLKSFKYVFSVLSVRPESHGITLN
jgi:hypothetical protein